MGPDKERRQASEDIEALRNAITGLQADAVSHNERMDRMEEVILVNTELVQSTANLSASNAEILQTISENTAGLVSAWNAGSNVVDVAKIGGKVSAYLSVTVGGLAAAWHYLHGAFDRLVDFIFYP